MRDTAATAAFPLHRERDPAGFAASPVAPWRVRRAAPPIAFVLILSRGVSLGLCDCGGSVYVHCKTVRKETPVASERHWLFRLVPGRKMFFGTAADCAIRIEDTNITPHHATIECVGDWESERQRAELTLVDEGGQRDW